MENNSVAFAVITSIIAVLIFIFIYFVNGNKKEKDDDSKSIDDNDQQLEKKDKGKNLKKKKNISDKHKEIKAQFTHPWLMTTLKGHTGHILDMDYSSNGKYLISCDEGKRTLVTDKECQENKKNRKKKKQCDSEFVEESYNFIVNKNNCHQIPSKWYKKLGYSEEQLYQKLKEYILNKEEQKKYGFPVECPSEPGKALILNEYIPYNNNNNNNLDQSYRICCRCQANFYLSEDGSYSAKDECIYHWGKKKKIEIKDSDKPKYIYSCCNGELESDGCMQNRYHVSNQLMHNLNKFVKTKEKLFNKNTKNYGIFALDCEMCFTTKGLEIAKVSVVKSNGILVYDTFVLPENPIIDYNTYFSGITAKDLMNVSTTIEDVHEHLLKLFNSKTILIGHGLENDLKALRLIHDTIIDTSVVFPHFFGFPLKRSLKSLISYYLHKIIQESETGHDSAEDARACMELMLWKLFKDKKQKQNH